MTLHVIYTTFSPSLIFRLRGLLKRINAFIDLNKDFIVSCKYMNFREQYASVILNRGPHGPQGGIYKSWGGIQSIWGIGEEWTPSGGINK